MNSIRKAIICCRVSSDKQVREGNGLESQELRCRQYAQLQGYEVVAVFQDKGESGAIFNRTSIKETLRFLENDLKNNYVVIFDDIKRIARDIEIHWEIKKRFGALGATIESPNFKFDDSPEGRFVETVLAGGAQLEREQNARQVKQKMLARIESGYWCLTVPFGMFYDTTEKGKVLTYHNRIAPILKEAIEGFETGKFPTQTDVLHYLKMNSETLGPRRFDLKIVKRILTEILYTGYLEYPKWGVSRMQGVHKSIITIETYNSVQAKLDTSFRSISKWELNNPDFPLRKLVTCSKCGRKLTGSRVKGKAKYYSVYTCNNKDCIAKPKNIQKQVLEAAYVEMLDKASLSPKLISLTRAVAKDAWNEIAKEHRLAEKDTTKQIERKEAEISKYLELILSTSRRAVIENYERRIEDLEAEIQALNNSDKVDPAIDFEKALNRVLDFIGTPHTYWEKADIKGKYLIHNLLFTECPSFDLQNGFGTPPFSLIMAIKKESSDENSFLVDPRGFELLTSSVQTRRSSQLS